MTEAHFERPGPKEAGPELLILAKWEEHVAWLFVATGKWPKSARFTLTQRIENHALDVLEMLVSARYEPAGRRETLRKVNLLLERMRFLLRVARQENVMAARGFETALRGIDEAGRMLHGWREALNAPRG